MDSNFWLGVPLIVLVGAVTIHGVLGTGFVLDDWYLLRNAEFDGPFSVADPALRAARPGTLVVYGLSFGVFGREPTLVFLVQVLLLAAATVLASLLLKRFLPAPVAGMTVALWVLLPNHLSLEVWPSVLVANASLVLLLAGALCLARKTGSLGWLSGACGFMAASCLTYEASIILAATAFVVLPWLSNGRVSSSAIVAGAGTLGAVSAWQILNWHEVKDVGMDPLAFTRVFEAHLGWGIVSDGPLAKFLLVLGLLGSVLAFARLVLPSFRAGTGDAERLVVAGWIVIIGGSLPFALYLYEPLGAGDRVNYVSSLGAAMVWIGLIWSVQRTSVVLAVACAVVIVTATGVTRWERSETWSTAASDALAIFEQTGRLSPDCRVVVFGPERIQEGNVASYLDRSNVNAAVELAFRTRDVEGDFLLDPVAFVDFRPDCRIDLAEISDLGRP